MEYLVTMTTHVPEGTPESDIEDMRAREAAHSRKLAAQGSLLRLWRPPLRPGEWRSLGLFAAADDAGLEEVLTSMPLRVWRSDEYTPLAPHRNDPPSHPAPAGQPWPNRHEGEFLTTFVITIPQGTPAEEVEVAEAREASRAQELAGEGHLERLWQHPGEGQTLGLWRADDDAGLERILDSLPLRDWMIVQITPLTPHPSDPALADG